MGITMGIIFTRNESQKAVSGGGPTHTALNIQYALILGAGMFAGFVLHVSVFMQKRTSRMLITISMVLTVVRDLSGRWFRRPHGAGEREQRAQS